MISERSIREVKDRVDIIDVVGNFTTIKKKGANWQGCCPFHDENTPSFNVSPAKGIYKCFGCGESGDSITFLMAKEKMSYVEAIEWLAAYYNVPLEQIQETRTKEEIEQEKSKYESAIAIIDTAAKRYQRNINSHPDVMAYLLTERKMSLSSILDWQVGFAPGGNFIALPIAQVGKQFIAQEIGLIKCRETEPGETVEPPDWYDTLHSRITFPVIDHRGRKVGISGRILPGADKKYGKYINPSESFLYNKSNVLYGLHQAATAKAFKKHGCAILVEGYTDVISMHHNGFDCTVATCGTALTKEQSRLLKKYTDTVLIMRDGDAAGNKAMLRDVNILLEEGFKVYVCQLPKGEDPDTFSRSSQFILWLMDSMSDAVQFVIDPLFSQPDMDVFAQAQNLLTAAETLVRIQSETLREYYIDHFRDKYKLKTKLKEAVAKAKKRVEAKLKQEEEERQQKLAVSHGDNLPNWVPREQLHENGFVQLDEEREGYKPGIYFKVGDDFIKRYTNFTIKPLYHIYDPTNNRRLVAVNNGRKKAVIEMPSRAFVSMDAFLICLIEKGAFTWEPAFTKLQFVRIVAWLSETMPHCYELKTLGWQPEGFFAFANKVAIPDEEGVKMHEFNDMGIVEIKGQHYISMGASLAHSDNRGDDNIYENDMYLKWVEAPCSFKQWAELFSKVYGDNAPFGIAYIFISLFKDIVTATTKCPILYAYGQKGSGKSEFSESILWFFFSGKNSENKPIQGYNLNPGQGTPFSFYNLQNRYRNVAIHFNEFDENNIEDWKFGSFKAFYDGQGREVGDGGSGKARKTTVQKTQGTLVLAGQYISTRDDGSVLSRAITCQFDLSRVEKLTDEQTADFKTIKEFETKGLSSLVCDLLKYRFVFKEKFNTVYWDEYNRLLTDVRSKYGNPETRLVKNYAACLAVLKLMGTVVDLPFSYQHFYNQCMRLVISHNSLLKENNSLNSFFKSLEYMYDKRMLNYENYKPVEKEFAIITRKSVLLKYEGKEQHHEFDAPKKLLMMRFSMIYNLYAKQHRESKGKQAQDESTLLKYLQDQPYFIGLCPKHRFDDKNTSCYVLDYEKAELNLDGGFDPDEPKAAPSDQNSQISLLNKKSDDTDTEPPF